MRVYVELNLIPFELWFKTPMIGVVLEWASVNFWQDSLWTTLVLLIFKHTFLWIKFSLRYLYKCWIWFSVGFFFWEYKIHPDTLYCMYYLCAHVLDTYTIHMFTNKPCWAVGIACKAHKMCFIRKFRFCLHDTSRYICLLALFKAQPVPDFCLCFFGFHKFLLYASLSFI